jgi:MarR-like DNA-binding transcriptional regulator SgrR of sgrS sRNA
MRQLQKIRQYQRLYQHYGAEPKPTTIAEVAETPCAVSAMRAPCCASSRKADG